MYRMGNVLFVETATENMKTGNILYRIIRKSHITGRLYGKVFRPPRYAVGDIFRILLNCVQKWG